MMKICLFLVIGAVAAMEAEKPCATLFMDENYITLRNFGTLIWTQGTEPTKVPDLTKYTQHFTNGTPEDESDDETITKDVYGFQSFHVRPGCTLIMFAKKGNAGESVMIHGYAKVPYISEDKRIPKEPAQSVTCQCGVIISPADQKQEIPEKKEEKPEKKEEKVIEKKKEEVKKVEKEA